MTHARWMGAMILVLLFAVTAHAQLPLPGSCSNASLKGTWGLLNFGTISAIGPFGSGGAAASLAGPFASVAVVTADGSGNLISGANISNVNGVAILANFAGTYTVNSNCTGTATLSFTTPTRTPGTPGAADTPGTAQAPNPFNPGQPATFRFVQVAPTGPGQTPTTPAATPAALGQAIMNFVLVDDGTEFFYSFSDAGTAITGRAKKQQILPASQ